MQARHIAGLLRVLPHAHSPLTTPSLASASAPPTTPNTIIVFYSSSLTMRGTLRSGGRLRGSGSTGRSKVSFCKHAHKSTKPRPSCARPCQHNANTDKLGTKSHAQSAGRGTARYLQDGSTLPECTVRQAATTCGVPANCSSQPTLPYDTVLCINTNTTVETAQLPAPITITNQMHAALPCPGSLLASVCKRTQHMLRSRPFLRSAHTLQSPARTPTNAGSLPAHRPGPFLALHLRAQ